MNELTNDKGTYLFDSEKFDAIKSRMENKMTMQPTDREKELGDLLIVGGKKSGKSFELGRQLGRQEVIDWGNKPISELEVLWQKAVDDKRYPEASFILYLIDTRKDYTKLAEFCHDNKLGMGGESLVNVIIESYNQLKDKTK